VTAEPGSAQPLGCDRVWRRIPPRHFPKKPKQDRPNSPAFDDEDGGSMSVVLAREGRTPASALAGHVNFGVVELDVALLEELGLTVRPDPVAREPDHAVVEGRKTDAVRKRMAKGAKWVVRPPEAYPTSDAEGPG
jgi:hypothetical protein